MKIVLSHLRSLFLGLLLAAALPAAADRSGFWPFHPPHTDYGQRSATDVSFLLDGPAGRHGALSTRPDGHFYFADGTRARFWGVNLADETAFPDHALAERLAARIARAGFNLVRLTHMDAGWEVRRNIFDPGRDDTRHLSEDSLDRLDYLLMQLQRRGAYVFVTLLSARKFKAGDGVREFDDVFYGASLVSHFDRPLIELQKEYARALLDHRNRYTGRTLREGGQLALLEITNEDSLLDESRYAERMPASYLADLTRECRKHDPAADPGRHPFDAATRRALYRVESGYYGEMRDFLRKLGVSCPITGSNYYQDLGPAVLADAETDFISRQSYWDHPEGGWSHKDRFKNRSSLRSVPDGIIPTLAPMRVSGKPFVVMEWGFCWHNDYIAEGPLQAASYGSLQDWDAMLWYNLSGGDFSPTLLGETEHEVFDLGSKPHVLNQFPIAALVFLRRDLPAMQEVVHAAVSAESLFSGHGPSEFFDPNDALEKRLEIEVGARRDTKVPKWNGRAVYHAPGASWSVKSGVLLLTTARTVAVIGACGGHTYGLSGVTLRVTTPFCAIALTSLDGRPIGLSHHLLLSASARAENTGARYSADRTRLLHAGGPPILLERVRALLTLPDGNLSAWALGEDGQRRTPLQVRGRSIDLGDSPALWYEIERQEVARMSTMSAR